MHGSSVTELHCSNALHRFLPLTLDEVLVTYSEPLDALIMIPDGPLLAVNTASGQKSIWQHLNYDQFRTKVVALERASKEVPCDRKFIRERSGTIQGSAMMIHLVCFLSKSSNELLTISHFLLLPKKVQRGYLQ